MNTIIFDIETGPLPEGELAALVPPFDPAEVKTGNIKDPEKIAAKIAEAEASHRREFFEKAALDPLTGRVVAIGMLLNAECGVRNAECDVGDTSPRPSAPVGAREFRVIAHEDEAVMLREFWDVARGEMGRINEMVGFNTHLFDLPFLIRRSWKHRVSVPRGIRRGRYWGDEMVDLRDAWQLGDRQARGSLDAVARHLGVGAKCVPHGPMGGKLMTGADFAAVWASDRAKAIEYLRNDVELTAKVAQRLGVLSDEGGWANDE